MSKLSKQARKELNAENWGKFEQVILKKEEGLALIDQLETLEECYKRLLRDVLEYYVRPGTPAEKMCKEMLEELEQL